MASQPNPNEFITEASEHLPSVTTNLDSLKQNKTPSTALYQSERLSACAKQLIHTFTGKPVSLGGPALDKEARLQNRAALCRQLGLPTTTITVPDQTHSATSKYVSDPDLSACDAVIVTTQNQPAMVLTADCTPLIVYDPKQHIGAIIHAGWRGTAASITAKTIQKMVHEHNCNVNDLIAAIGPCISGCCYEVSQEVADALEKTVPPESKPLWYFPQQGKNPKVDLKAVNRLQLEALGVSRIDLLPHCTFCQNEQFFSHRRGESGRQGTLLMLK